MRRLRLAPLYLLGALALALAVVAHGDEPDPDTKPVLGLLAARRGETIADVGCGNGTWTFPLARAVGPTGKVYAVDIDPEAIATVRHRVEAEQVENVEVVHSVPDDPRLPAGRLDAIFMNDVIDWVERRALAGFLAGIHEALKPDGRVVIRDPSGGADRIIAELYRAGFALVEAKVPLEEAPARSFATGWYALKLRPARVQPSIFPRLGLPARYRVRLHLAEELFRMGLLTREELRAKWEALRDQPGAFDPSLDEARDLAAAAAAVGVLSEAEQKTVLERARGRR